MKALGVSLLALVGVTACSSHKENDSALRYRNLKASEAKADLNQLVSLVEGYYGPLAFKEKRFGFTLESLKADAERDLAAAQNDGDVYGVFARLLARFEDGHVSISFAGEGARISRFLIPIFVTPVQGKALISGILSPELSEIAGIAVGDEVVSVDGKRPMEDIAPIARKYKSLGNPRSDQHLVFATFFRDITMRELVPETSQARIIFKKPDGTLLTRSLPWQKKDGYGQSADNRAERNTFGNTGYRFRSPDGFEEASRASLMEMGSPNPYFITQQSAARLGLTPVKPSADALKAFGVDPEKAPKIFAAKYTFNGKNIALVRQPTYSVSDADAYLGTYKAILSELESESDVLVIDQNHNPGGDGNYATGFASLFLAPESAGLVQRNHADRAWIDYFDTVSTKVRASGYGVLADIFRGFAQETEAAYDRGDALTGFLPFLGGETISPDASYSWKKPILVLADELAGSCGDIFPLLMKSNHRARIFGETTMGLGGNVEEVGQLVFSRASVNLTRGLYAAYRADGQYGEDDFVENKGVAPDYPHTLSVEDFRAGFVGYVEAFSTAAVQQAE